MSSLISASLPIIQRLHRRTTEEWLKSLGQKSHHSTNTPSLELPFQRWFKFKEAFSPQIIIDCLHQAGGSLKSSFDPFGGCGTTGVTSQFMGLRPTLIEVNPFIADLAEAKLASYDRLALLDDFEFLIASLSRVTAAPSREQLKRLPATFCAPGVNGRYLFPKPTLYRILSLRELIKGLENPLHRRLFRVLLGSILVTCSNVVVNGKGRKYRQGWQESEKSPADVDRLFASAFTVAIQDLERYTSRAELGYSIKLGSCLQQSQNVTAQDVAICSPPYPNSFDYTDIYNIELWVLGYLKTTDDNQRLRKSTLQSHVQCRFEESGIAASSPTLTTALRKLHRRRDDLWDRRIPGMIEGYFSDLSVLLGNMQSALRKDASAFFVVGDSCYADVPVAVADILAEVAEGMGYEVKSNEVVRKMRMSAQQGGGHALNESILHLTNRTSSRRDRSPA